jgi:hypothetical protein
VEGAQYGIIGPWQENFPNDTAIDAIIRRNNILHHLRGELIQYLNVVPRIESGQSWEALLYAHITYIYGGHFQVRVFRQKMDFDDLANTYSPDPDATLLMKVIEERYNIENELIAAVSEGDADKALRCKSQLKTYQERRVEDRQRNSKNYLIVLNTLLRKAVENGYVHPAHIDAVSADFAHRIEGVTNFSELNRLADVMIRRYCSLVKEFSLRHYSPLIRDVINTVDFNLPEPLSLTSLVLHP